MAIALTIRFRQRNLPHWEVEGGRYFITVRCGDSLPAHAVLRLREMHAELSEGTTSPARTNDRQRQVFRALEKYLDAGFGACPLRQPEIAAIIETEFEALADSGISVPHYSIMPNHWHALLVPADPQTFSLSEVMKRLKGRTGKRIRQKSGGSGPFWQSEWFDRWIRDESQWDRIVKYIHNNAVKAGLVENWQDHPWTR